VTGNATNYKNSQGDNSIICSTRDEISQPSRPISPRAATAVQYHHLNVSLQKACWCELRITSSFNAWLLAPVQTLFLHVHHPLLYPCVFVLSQIRTETGKIIGDRRSGKKFQLILNQKSCFCLRQNTPII